MAVEISVGPPSVTINQGDTFMVADENGEIHDNGEMGIFSGDTRFLSQYLIFADGRPWQRLSSAATTYYAARFYLANGEFESPNGVIPRNSVSLCIERDVGHKGICEELRICNYAPVLASFNLEIALASDFADIFDVRAGRIVRRGHMVTQWDDQRLELRTAYKNADFERQYVYRLLSREYTTHFANGRVIIEIELPPQSTCSVSARHELIFGEAQDSFPDRRVGEKTRFDELHAVWQMRATKASTSNEEIYRFFTQSVEDIGALRLYENEPSPDSFTPSAGVPWYVALFGRDSLVACLQTMIVNSKFSLGTLKRLSQYQAREMDDWRDAEPGKILHEMRFGELAHFKKIPHSPYYGTADATPLYLVVLHEAWKWLGQKSIIESYRDVAVRCLDWIDKYGDLDGDGLQEFQTRSPFGYENMCWKDSEDSIVYPDGTQVKQPKGTCELQGYVFDAWLRMAEVFEALGETERSRRLKAKAAKLQRQFTQKFWCDDIDFVALALDADKNPVKTIASNAGHCLWSGILTAEQADLVMRRLLKDDMMTGWGVRTLSAAHPSFNAHSYHCGSVWPHDNGILTMGLKRYGFTQELSRIFRDVSEAASMFRSHRIPELYAGIERELGSFPVQYPGANIPQAWAAGAVFHMLQATLGLQADAPNGFLYVDPVLPRWLPDISLHGIVVGDSVVDLEFFREKDRTGWEASVREGSIKVEQRAWTPASIA